MSHVVGHGLSASVTTLAAVLSEQVAGRLEAALKEVDLGLGAFELLSAVKTSPSATQAEIAARLGITPSSLCEAVRSASAKGLVEQEDSPNDRRAKRVALTRKGARVLDSALSVLELAEERATAGIPGSKLLAAVDVLRQAAQNLADDVTTPSQKKTG